MLSSAIGYLAPDWQDFTMVVCIMIFFHAFLFPVRVQSTNFPFEFQFSIPYFQVFPESTVWLFSKGRKSQGRKNLEIFAKRTKCKLDDDFADLVIEDMKQGAGDNKEESKQFSLIDLFRHKNIRKITFAISISFCVNTLVYYGQGKSQTLTSF